MPFIQTIVNTQPLILEMNNEDTFGDLYNQIKLQIDTPLNQNYGEIILFLEDDPQKIYEYEQNLAQSLKDEKLLTQDVQGKQLECYHLQLQCPQLNFCFVFINYNGKSKKHEIERSTGLKKYLSNFLQQQDEFATFESYDIDINSIKVNLMDTQLSQIINQNPKKRIIINIYKKMAVEHEMQVEQSENISSENVNISSKKLKQKSPIEFLNFVFVTKTNKNKEIQYKYSPNKTMASILDQFLGNLMQSDFDWTLGLNFRNNIKIIINNKQFKPSDYDKKIEYFNFLIENSTLIVKISRIYSGG